MSESALDRRKPVTMLIDPQKGRLHVACDDGSIWVHKGSFGWTSLDPIPGSAAAEQGSGKSGAKR
ncbi:MAG: hypothetical protein ACR2QM_08605 [Longimicrobiales bacterium]